MTVDLHCMRKLKKKKVKFKSKGESELAYSNYCKPLLHVKPRKKSEIYKNGKESLSFLILMTVIQVGVMIVWACPSGM